MSTPRVLESTLICAAALALTAALAVPTDTPAPGSAPARAPARAAATLANLQTAFAAEKNTESRYLTFARQADREGYRAVASLFRAAARAEAIHARNHVRALAWLNAEARVQLEQNYADGTLANLAASIVEEATLADETYPAWLGQARADRQTAAMRAFNYALGAEADHAQLMVDALGGLPHATTATPYYVCPGCGRTVTTRDARRCPVCFTAAKGFEKVI
jgi:rubrerythrin